MPRKFVLLLGVLSLLIAEAPARGRDTDGAGAPTRPVETWADPGLTLTRGLVLWLDAGRLNAAREGYGLPEVVNGSAIDVWHDASGHGRHLVQPRVDVRPTFEDGAVRFDGIASHLERQGADLRLEGFTLFLVAAPFSNAGGFRGFLALNQEGQDDFTSGLTVDMGFGFTGRFEALNVEGEGFGGMADLMFDPSEFGIVRRVTITSISGASGTRLRVDGQSNGARDRQESILDVDRITVGARRHGIPVETRGFLDGDLLHVLLYDRVLDDVERREVEAYLARRLGGEGRVVRLEKDVVGTPLVSIEDPPPVQVLVPGVSARELPVELSNINNVAYRGDGVLVALAYDGDIHLLTDGDDDGLEETVGRFWENTGSLVAPIGMALTPPGDPRGDGVFVASKGKVSLILDRDRDREADEEIIVASGWKELPHGVDALGVAVDEAGHVYFGLGTTNFTNPYLVGLDGRAAYRLDDEHGSIQEVSPDFQHRRIIATGIRFPVALAFNRHGDLFATDQEGATWLPNGNPFDELLHIQPGRHYGFPPRHPDHLPSVIDEPSVFDYAPQHQSTCGLTFNEPVGGGPTFGPPHWAGDAIVAGYSRGKLFRTEMGRTAAGYVARNHILAVLDRLAVDACVSHAGDLVVAAHSGLPDWGSGPAGEGRLYKLSYDDPEAPQPVLAWAPSPQEVRIAFDRPLDPAGLEGLAGTIAIEYGAAVRPGDRFESLRPGYEVVGRQMNAPRFELPILSTGVSPDRRTLILATAPHPEASSYAITLPGLGRPEATQDPPGALAQAAAVDLGYDLSGVEASWLAEDGGERWSGWLPHVNLDLAREFTAGSAEHDWLWDAIGRPGRLTLRTKIDLWQMLRPAVQPGSTIDYSLPGEEVTVVFSASAPIELTTPDRTSPPEAGGDGRPRVAVVVTPEGREPVPVEITLETGGRPSLDVTWTTREDARPRALPLRRVLVPWATLESGTEAVAGRVIPELEGGDWARGRAVFFGEQARCSSCHAVRGRGGAIGPDLSNLIHRDYASVLRDIQTPGAALNPDYIAHAVALADGRVLQGTLRTDGARLIVGDVEGRETIVDRAEVEATSPSSASIMPEGIDSDLGADGLRDVMTFLLTDPLGPAPGQEGSPPPRSRADLDAVLEGRDPVEDPGSILVVLAAGRKDHGPGEHDYPLWQRRWSALLATDEAVRVETADGWPAPRQLDEADVIVFYSNNPGWDEAKAAELDRFLSRGGGVVLIHYAVDGHEAVDALADRIGLAWQGGASQFRHGPLRVDLSGAEHPITRGFEMLDIVDESYWNLVGDPGSVEVLGTGIEDGEPRPLFWTRRVGEGRVFVSIPGHYTWTFDDPLFRMLILRGIAWVAGEPVDRFNELATLGARLRD
ncbi:ThuA domain-containing protein [Tautonia plasticadhaerens]|uniref:Trehalose utilization n=1 Tax=Tautonia plasticadhaerens TaxID=2527974 RepID=A0A518HA86_9BACT|nr:ThuA domain-containing protein [Tautonia plasticadhaerens]QDV37764.1 Trehalose utilization [Tautonia plasticadhaerens]